MCEAAVTLADRGHVAAILAVTRGGKTAGLLSALRPGAPIVAATDQPVVARRLALSWGVMPLLTTLGATADATATQLGQVLVERGLIQSGSAIVVVSMAPGLDPGPSNFLKVQAV